MVRQSLKTEKEVIGLEILTKEQKNIVIREVAEECIKNDILKEFLVKNLREVENMSIWEYDEEKHIKMEREDAYKDGEARGIALGEARGIALGREEGEENERRKNIITTAKLLRSVGLSEEDIITKIREKYTWSDEEIKKIQSIE